MSTTPNRHCDEDGTLSPELRAVGAMLDRAGAAERASPPRGFEDRLFDATRGALAGSSGAAGRIGPRPWVLSRSFRLAAGVVVAAVGVVAAAWLARTGGTAAPGAAAPAHIAELSRELDADLAAWELEREWHERACEVTPLAVVHEALDALESGASEDPWAAFDAGLQEPSL